MAITTAISKSFDVVRSYAGSLTWAPVVNLSRSSVLSLLRKVKIGQLVIVDTDGTVTICGSPKPKDGSTRTELKVSSEAFWVRLLLFADMVGCALRPGGRT